MTDAELQTLGAKRQLADGRNELSPKPFCSVAAETLVNRKDIRVYNRCRRSGDDLTNDGDPIAAAMMSLPSKLRSDGPERSGIATVSSVRGCLAGFAAPVKTPELVLSPKTGVGISSTKLMNSSMRLRMAQDRIYAICSQHVASRLSIHPCFDVCSLGSRNFSLLFRIVSEGNFQDDHTLTLNCKVEFITNIERRPYALDIRIHVIPHTCFFKFR